MQIGIDTVILFFDLSKEISSLSNAEKKTEQHLFTDHCNRVGLKCSWRGWRTHPKGWSVRLNALFQKPGLFLRIDSGETTINKKRKRQKIKKTKKDKKTEKYTPPMSKETVIRKVSHALQTLGLNDFCWLFASVSRLDLAVDEVINSSPALDEDGNYKRIPLYALTPLSYTWNGNALWTTPRKRKSSQATRAVCIYLKHEAQEGDRIICQIWRTEYRWLKSAALRRINVNTLEDAFNRLGLLKSLAIARVPLEEMPSLMNLHSDIIFAGCESPEDYRRLFSAVEIAARRAVLVGLRKQKLRAAILSSVEEWRPKKGGEKKAKAGKRNRCFGERRKKTLGFFAEEEGGKKRKEKRDINTGAKKMQRTRCRGPPLKREKEIIDKKTTRHLNGVLLSFLFLSFQCFFLFLVFKM